MNRRISPSIILALFLLSLLSSHLFAATRGIRVIAKEGQSLYLYRDYHALVVGVSSYERWPKLPNAVNDAKEVASKLKELGFEVKLVLDPTSREMKTVLNEMVYRMGTEEKRALLFYYAGHGETETLADKTKMGYIIPRDCPLLGKDPMGFAAHAISMRDIESVSMRIKSKHVLMLFDSCFSGSLFALVRAVPDDITEKSTLPVRQYITAGREDEQVPDRSTFKRCFLIGLGGDADLTGDGYITGSELGMYLSDKVVNYTHRRQHPQYGKINNPDLDRGDFIFIPLKVREKQIAEEKKRQEEESALAAELKRLQEERKKSGELMEQMRRLLEAQRKAREERMLKEDAEKEALEEELKRLREEKEAAEKKALEAELRRLREEKDKGAQRIKEPKAQQAQENRLASIPKEVTEPVIPKVTLRDIPEELWDTDVKTMVERHNFFAKGLNEGGDFPNDFVDNGDGTITDRATGLMWQKGGSSSAFLYWKVKKYVSGLNEERFSGYDDWRMPTLEELCSLLEPAVNERVQHISSLFEGKQSVCWSADRGGPVDARVLEMNHIVNFTKGKIKKGVTSGGWRGSYPEPYFIRAVRTVR